MISVPTSGISNGKSLEYLTEREGKPIIANLMVKAESQSEQENLPREGRGVAL